MTTQSDDKIQVLAPVTPGATSAPAASAALTNAENAHKLFMRLSSADNEEATKRARIRNQIDGNAPYSQSKLIAAGQAWRCNVNFREAESIRDSNIAAYWSLFTEVPELIGVRLREMNTPAEMLQSWERIIAEEYTTLLMDDWEDFYYFALMLFDGQITYGLGSAGWIDRFDWRPQAFQIGQVLLPRLTKSTVGGIRVLMLRGSIPARDLIKIIETKDESAAMGWNVAEVKLALFDRWAKGKLQSSQPYAMHDFEAYVQAAKNYDGLQDESDLEDLNVVYAVTLEPRSENGVALRIFPAADARKAYLFEKINCYENMQQAYCPFVYNVGDGFIHSVRGVGHRVFQAVELSNRLLCTTFDGAMLSASIIVNNTGGKKDLRLMRVGPMTQLPEGVTPINQAFQPRLDQLTGARSMLQMILNNSHGIYQKYQEHVGMPERTATEAQIAEEKEARLSNYQILQFYVHADRLHREMMRRLLSDKYPSNHPGYDLAQRFIKRCVERGVPRAMLKYEKMQIRSQRAIGAGSAALRKIALEKVLGSSALIPSEQGRRDVFRAWLSAHVGQDSADRWMPRNSARLIATMDHTLASIENNQLANGQPVTVSSEQQHGIYLEVHVESLMQTAQAVSELLASGRDFDPTTLLRYMQVAIPHCEEHLGFYRADPRNKGNVPLYEERLSQIAKVAAALAKYAQALEQERAQAAQEMGQQVADAQQVVQSADTMVKLAKVKADAEVAMYAAKTKAEIAAVKAQHAMQLKEIKLAHDMQLKGGQQ